MALGKNDISVSLVRNTLNFNSFDVGTLCSCNNINQWSAYKPFSFADNNPSETIRGGKAGSGFTYVEHSRSPFKYYTVQYNRPTGGASSPYRLGDFRSYNHQSLTPQLRRLNADFPQHIPEFDVVVAPTDSVGKGKVQICLPDIQPAKMPNSPHQDEINKVSLIDYVNNKRLKLWSMNFDESGTNPIRYDNYKNTEIIADIEMREGLPSASGSTVTRTVYLEFGGFEVASIPLKISKSWKQDPNNDLLWRAASRTEVSNNSILSYFDFSDSTMQYLLRYESSDRSMIRLNKLKVKSTQAAWMIDIYIQDASSNWVQVCRFRNNGNTAASFTLYNGASFFSAPKYTTITDGSASFSIDTKIEISNKSLKEYNVKIVGSVDYS